MLGKRMALAGMLIGCTLTAGAQEAPAPPLPAEAPAGPVDIRQVQIQVWISETNEQGLRDIGNNLYYTRFVRGEEQSGSLQQVTTNLFDPVEDFGGVTLPAPSSNPPTPPYYPPEGTDPITGDPIPQPNPGFDDPLRPDENPALEGIQTREGFGLAYSIINPGHGTIDGVFRSIEHKADVDLISKPELLVVNGSQAAIKAGGAVPYQTVQYPKGRPNLGIAWRDVGVNLTFTPTIMPNNFVELNVETLEVSDIARIENLRGVDLPVFSKRSQTGFVYVPDGQTLVIGGLSSRAVRRTERRVPVVGKIPVLGMPFRARRSEADILHLLIFVSPTIVDLRNPTNRAFSALRFWQERGSEWANADRIESEIEAMAEEL